MTISPQEQAYRNHRPRLRRIRFFYTACQFCKDKVKHELMWTAVAHDDFDGSPYNVYLCTVCCHDAETVMALSIGKKREELMEFLGNPTGWPLRS